MEKQEINSHGIDLVVRNIPVSVAWWLNARNPYPTSSAPEVVTYFMDYAKNGISGQRNSSRNKESDNLSHNPIAVPSQLFPCLLIAGSTRALSNNQCHNDVIKWKNFPRYWPFVRESNRSPVNSPHISQWRRALMLSLICTWINGWVNNCEAGDLRRHCTHYDIFVMGVAYCRPSFAIISQCALDISWSLSFN